MVPELSKLARSGAKGQAWRRKQSSRRVEEESLPLSLTTRQRHRIFTLYVLIMALVFLVPVPTTPLAESRHLDKLVHFGVFMGFALLFHLDRPLKLRWMFLISCAFAGAIELVQWFLPYRDADWWDFVAGAAGAGAGVVLVLWRHWEAERKL
jgi:VanZ family protein